MFTGSLLRGWGARAGAICVALFFLAFASGAQAETILIDDFSAPASEEPFLSADVTFPPLALVPKSSVFAEDDDPAILGGQRDMLIEVVGELTSFAATGTVGGPKEILEVLTGGRNSGAYVTLQYDGVDAGDSEAGLNNASFPAPVDLTSGGTNDHLRLAFEYLAPEADVMNLEVKVFGDGGQATFDSSPADVPKSPAAAFDYNVPFSAFDVLPLGTDPLANAERIEIVFNNPVGGPVSHVDFALDAIEAVPEPSTLALLSLAMAMIAVGARARRRR